MNFPLSGYADDPGESIYQIAFLILLASTTLFRFFYVQWIELAPDESYYFTWSRWLQWGYYDHPPMVGFLIYLGTALGGMTELGVRLPCVVSSALLSLILYRMGSEMFRSVRMGFYSALLMNMTLLGSVGAIIATPDTPQALFWAAAVYLTYKAVNGEGSHHWYFTGIMLGLGLLSKYTMILFPPCVLLFLLASRESRKWLARKEPYLGLALGLMIFFPVILWNARHDWISFLFQLKHGVELKQTSGLRTFGDFWAGQAGLVSPFLFLALLWAMARSAIQGLRCRADHLLLLFCTSAPVLFFFGLASVRTRVEGNWPGMAYFSAAVALAGLTLEGWRQWGKTKRALGWVAGGSAVALTLLVYLHSLHPFIPIAPKKDQTSQLYGWHTLGQKIEEVASSVQPGEKVFVLGSTHKLVGETMFYTHGKYPVYEWNAPQRINNLAADHSPPTGSTAIFVNMAEKELPQGLAPLFDSCETLEPLTIFRRGSPVREYGLWKCVGFKGFKTELAQNHSSLGLVSMPVSTTAADVLGRKPRHVWGARVQSLTIKASQR